MFEFLSLYYKAHFMLHKLVKPLIGLSILAITYSIGNRIYLYHTHAQPPHIIIEGVKQDGYYKGIIEGKIVANNPYKIATLQAQLDQAPLSGIPTNPSSKKFSHSFTINTEQLTNGEHTLTLNAIDSSKRGNQRSQSVIFHVDNLPLNAAFVETNYRVDQGKTAHIKIKTNKPVATTILKVFNKTFNCFADTASSFYECFIPIGCEEQPTIADVTAEVADHVGQTQKITAILEIAQFNFPKQKGFSVSAEKLSAEREISMKQDVLGEAIERWAKESPTQKLWQGPFVLPMQVRRMTTPFGEIRVTAEKGRYLHKGVDLVNMPRSVVWAAQDGNIIIKDRFAMSGNTIVIDHGLGVTTEYAHLDSFAEVEVGQTIKKGCPVGKVGMTGYANGYHLHWELHVNGIAVDPLEWTEKVY